MPHPGSNGAGPDGEGGDRDEFQLADEPARRPTQPPRPESPTPPRPLERPASTTDHEPLIRARRKGRLLRQVPGFAVGFLLVGWICLGSAAWPFALTGAALGAWAGWSRRGEALVGSVAALVGLATWFAVVGFVPGMGMGIVIVGCGIVGFVAGLDDRLRGA